MLIFPKKKKGQFLLYFNAQSKVCAIVKSTRRRVLTYLPGLNSGAICLGFLVDKAPVVGKGFFSECLEFPLPVSIPTVFQKYQPLFF